jgi:photosystem II stability/assembly factor-like uncharacterized protein
MSKRTFGIKYAFLGTLAIAATLAVLYLWPRRNAGAVSSSTVEQRLQMPSIAKSRVQRIGDVPSSVKDSDGGVQLRFVTERHGWLSTEKELWETKDGGKNWLIVYDAPSDSIRQFQFIDSQVGWMLTGATLYRTNDGGLTWTVPRQPLLSDSEGHLSSIKFLEDGRRGWVSGGIYKFISGEEYVPSRYLSVDEQQSLRGVIFYTEDGGNNWRRQLVTQHWGQLTALFATDAERAWVGGTAGVFYLSNRTCAKCKTPSQNQIRRSAVFDAASSR